MTKTTVCIVGLVCVGLASAVFASGKTRPFLTRFGVCTMTDLTEKIENADDAAHVERYFHHEDEAYDADLYCAAKRIARKQPLTEGELAALKGKVNQRAWDDISLLPFALWKHNALAADQLLGLGADPTLPFKRKGPHAYESFISSVMEGTYPIATEMLKLYLKHGGDPNYRSGVNNTPLVADAALVKNYESYTLLIDHGADVWKIEGPSRYSPDGPIPDADIVIKPHDEKYDRTAIYIATGTVSLYNDCRFLDYAIASGALKGIEAKRIGYLIEWIGSYEMRDDVISRNIASRIRTVMEITGYPGNKRSARVLDYATHQGW